MNSVHTFPPYFRKIHSNIILSSIPSLPSGIFPLGFPTKILYAFLISTCPPETAWHWPSHVLTLWQGDVLPEKGRDGRGLQEAGADAGAP
jgi:hypothetical protein